MNYYPSLLITTQSRKAKFPTREDITYFGLGSAWLSTSHRSEIANTIINEARADLATFLDIPDDYQILFMMGGVNNHLKLDVKNYSLIFFGAQKNLESASIPVVVIKKNLVAPINGEPSAPMMRHLGLTIPPIILHYDTVAQNNSLYNTLSIFAQTISLVYIAGQVLKRALDSHPDVYRVVLDKSVRSRMNICFRVTKHGDIDAAEKDFLKQSTALGLTGLRGHRSVGGIRASN
ncbi:uncharacterized protein Triagg1_7982 [Trichoderma aggressivum f. europaeum]|uniref:phosphoserine transaminase n=1 Tax=Trichoderma aggressivum f. europaeum TaxID=173218 RepID=A0AAE1I8J8_9HYPO|nr:hypothetical protein Triagg1_7982 [Trichoderma aggressivum f. europaeum]